MNGILSSLADLRKRVLQLLLLRLLVPMLLFTFIIVTGAGYLSEKSLESKHSLLQGPWQK